MKNISTDLTPEDKFRQRQEYKKLVDKLTHTQEEEVYVATVNKLFDSTHKVNPFVLITQNDDVKVAYSKMVNSTNNFRE